MQLIISNTTTHFKRFAVILPVLILLYSDFFFTCCLLVLKMWHSSLVSKLLSTTFPIFAVILLVFHRMTRVSTSIRLINTVVLTNALWNLNTIIRVDKMWYIILISIQQISYFTPYINVFSYFPIALKCLVLKLWYYNKTGIHT